MTTGNTLREVYTEAFFVAFRLARHLLEKPDSEARQKIWMADIYAYATFPDFVKSAEVERILEINPVLRENFQLLLGRLARHSLPRLAAASSGVVTKRIGEGCAIHINPDPSNASNVYVIIEIENLDTGSPRLLFVGEHGKSWHREVLPPDHRGAIQLFTPKESDLVRWLQDIDSQILLV
jgi:hypothetical protein